MRRPPSDHIDPGYLRRADRLLARLRESAPIGKLELAIGRDLDRQLSQTTEDAMGEMRTRAVIDDKQEWQITCTITPPAAHPFSRLAVDGWLCRLQEAAALLKLPPDTTAVMATESQLTITTQRKDFVALLNEGLLDEPIESALPAHKPPAKRER